VVVLPVGVVVVDPEAGEVRVLVHDLEEEVVAVLAEALARGEVDLLALVGRVGRRVERLDVLLVVPLRVVGHVEDDLQALGLGRRDRLAEEVARGGAAARDLRRPRAGVAETAVERRQNEVGRVQLLRLPHPVARVPAAVGDGLLPLGAVEVLRLREHAPVQE
jgi:hypothetical protein